MKKTLLSIITLLFFVTLPNLILNAQTGSLRGFLTDKSSGEALAFGNVFIEELSIGATTNDKGYYFIAAIPSNKIYKIRYSYMGYESKEIEAKILSGKITKVDVELEVSTVSLQTIEKVAKKIVRQNETDIGLQRITIKELETLPMGVEVDVFRSLQYMPGVQTTGDVAARYYVRGGASNQNLVLFNGATIYNPFHALGLFSVIDPETINNVEFFKGGFTAEYGGRASSVLKIVTNDGNKNRFSGNASASLLTGKVAIEGPIPNGSFMITGRMTHSDKILKKFLNNTIPFNFYDYSFKMNYSDPDFIPGSKFVVHGFFSKDELDNENVTSEDFFWTNNIFGFKWFQVYDSPLLSELSVAVSNFKGEVTPNLSNAKAKNNELSDVSMNLDFTYIFESKDEIHAGLQVKSVNTDLLLENKNGISTNYSEKGANLSAFAKYKMLRFGNIGVDIGSRVNLATLNTKGNLSVEPRISTSYSFSPLLKIQAAYGVYQQSLTTVFSENDVISLFEPWIILPDYIEPTKSTHYTFGLNSYLNENWTVDIEAYYKKTKNVPIVNDAKSELNDNDFLIGESESYGWEFLSKLRINDFNFITSYSLSWAYNMIDDYVFYPKYDTRHVLNLTLDWDIGSGWNANISWKYNSGYPFTELNGYYDKLFIEDLFNKDGLYEAFVPYGILKNKNLGRLPQYHRMDISVRKKIDLDFVKITLIGSIINVYDRKNIFYFDRVSGKQVNMLPVLPTGTIRVEI